MYKNYTVDANLIASATYLAKNYPSLVLPFLELLEECINVYYKLEVELLEEVDETRYNELCTQFITALDEYSPNFKEGDFIYIPYVMHCRIRLLMGKVYVAKPNNVINFLKPIVLSS